jgi:shikimate dehydrogenase
MSAEAAAAGAVNTITVRDGKWLGTNTDAEGFLEPLRGRVADLRGMRAAILGAGGAARAAGLALVRAGGQVTICARRAEAAAAVAAAVGARAGEWPPSPGSWDLLINATPVGAASAPDASAFEGPFDGQLVYDLVYDPGRTELMRRAEQEGCATLGGLEMLVAQAERQFAIWTGQRPPAGLFADAAATAMRHR